VIERVVGVRGFRVWTGRSSCGGVQIRFVEDWLLDNLGAELFGGLQVGRWTVHRGR
jgi:hypothetical protein